MAGDGRAAAPPGRAASRRSASGRDSVRARAPKEYLTTLASPRLGLRATNRRTEDRQGDHPAGEDRPSAERAAALGIVNRVVPAAALEAEALALARHLAATDPALVRRTKQAINRSL